MTRHAASAVSPIRSDRAALVARLLDEDRAAVEKLVSLARESDADGLRPVPRLATRTRSGHRSATGR